MSRLARLGLVWAARALCACEPEVQPPVIDPPLPVSAERRIHLAGDEAATPLFRHLAEHFSALRPGLTVVVDSPLGASGARRAVEDGAIDGALVVTPLAGPGPEPEGTAIAVTFATLVTGPGTVARQIGTERLADLIAGHAGDAAPWQTLFLAAPEDPAQRALGAVAPPVGAALEDARAARRWPTFFEAQALRDAVRRTPGALAFTDAGSLRMLALPLWPVRLVSAAGEPVEDRLVVRLVPGASPRARLTEFVTFLRSPEGQALILDVGYGVP